MFDNFYGLSGKPFQLTPDPEFYFRSITHRKALSYLGYGLAQGEGFIVITGEIGSGKSTLVAHMMESLDPKQVTVAQIVTSALDESEVVHVVASAMGLDVEGHDKATALTEIESFLHEEARAGRRCLLVVDESQNLSVAALEELRMFSNFQLGSHPLLQTLLLGQPEFRVTLQNDGGLEQLRQRVIAAHHLEPMQKSEIEPYIIHRLEKVGWEGNPAFDQRVFAEVFEASGGIPRRVNQIANRLMLLGAVEERSRIDASLLQSVLSEMEAERAFPEAAPSPLKSKDPEFEPVKAMPTVPRVDMEMFEAAMADRDAQIAELQQAVVELSNQGDQAVIDVVKPEIEVMREQIALIEARCFEQERSIRQTLTMLIEWIEGEMESSKAA
ncbi:XrtA/PEP-CTERM system-associated ATPase [Aurantiacibacter marinus]|uniref:General secretion pathway protein n=1 Tax=Aurantiacibacter marinus TaxID=874156 RepID=A0A0H0XPY7_9SPHN|nr:XrtA/PEP-CTERM system-associated ATPase [Aurantiacibacter marinus]KLI64002.1 general secretion pathway protein [Aurantiacibacter marinus]